MHNVEEYLYQSFISILFCIAITIFFFSCNEINILLLSAKEKITNEELLSSTNEEINKNLISSDELTMILLNKLEYDIEIDGVLFVALSHNEKNLNATVSNGNYIKTYSYEEGIISKIIYRKIN